MFNLISKTYRRIENQLLNDIPVIKKEHSSLAEFYLWFTDKERKLSRSLYEFAVMLHGQEEVQENSSRRIRYI